MGSIGLSMQVIGSLLLIVLLAYGSIRFLGRKAGVMNSHALIKMVHSQQMGQNKSIHALVIDEKTVLIVGAGSQLETLARFDDADLAKRLLDQQTRQLFNAEGAWPKALTWLQRRGFIKRKQEDEQQVFSALVKRRLDDLSALRREQFSQLDEQHGKEQQPDKGDPRWHQ